MAQGQRISDETRAAILEDIRGGGSCRGIAETHGVSASFVSGIAKEHGLNDAFERAATKKATQARQADNRAERAKLATEALETAREMMRRGLKPKNGHDAQGWAIAFGIYVDKHLALEKVDVASSTDSAKSMLGKLFDGVKQAWREDSERAGDSAAEPQADRVGGDE